MRVAIATEGNSVAQHFGRCAQYTIYDIQNDEIIDKKVIDNPGHEPGFLPRFLAEKDVNCIIAGGMGPRAVNLFKEQNIRIILGARGSVEKVIQDFLEDNLEIGPSMCDH